MVWGVSYKLLAFKSMQFIYRSIRTVRISLLLPPKKFGLFLLEPSEGN